MTPVAKPRILLPLYIFPDPNAWDPLYSVLNAYPELHFTIIINPNSGPGSAPWWPNEGYVREIPKLNAYANVQTVGYVRTDYCKRPIREVFEDIEKYERWPVESGQTNLFVSGVFFDETPNMYSEGCHAYLCAITSQVKQGGLCASGRSALVVHNPGTAVDVRILTTGADITVVAEECYERFQSAHYQEWLATSSSPPAGSCYILHAVPEEKVGAVVEGLRGEAGHLFITDVKKNYYSSFGKAWNSFIAAMAKQEI